MHKEILLKTHHFEVVLIKTNHTWLEAVDLTGPAQLKCWNEVGQDIKLIKHSLTMLVKPTPQLCCYHCQNNKLQKVEVSDINTARYV